MPLNVAVPLPLSTKFTPEGSVPLAAIAGVGLPMAVIVKVPNVPTVNVVVFALVNVGAPLTVSVKDCVAAGLVPLSAVNVIAYVPAVPAAGVPPRVPVPSPVSTHGTPPGRAVPVRVIAGRGKPAVVTANVPAAPMLNVVAAALVIAGA